MYLKKIGILLLSFVSVACSGGAMKSYYSKSSVQPIMVTKESENVISLSYKVLPETMYYSKGVNYEVSNGEIRVFIDRCQIRSECSPMSETLIPLDERWMAKVNLPYRGEKIIMVYHDTEEQVYP